jgi:hypothetical protein
MITKIKNKQDLIRALGQNEITFIEEIEAVNDYGLRAATEKVKWLITKGKKVHVVLIERT